MGRIRVLFVARQSVSLHVVLHRGSTRRQQYQRDRNGSGRLEKLFGDRRFSTLVVQYNTHTTRKIGNWNIIIYIEGELNCEDERTNETIPIAYKIRKRN